MPVWQALLEDKLEWIRRYTELGLRVLPVHGMIEGMCTCQNPSCPNPGKHPLLATGVYAATLEFDWLKGMFQSSPYSNVALAAGADSNFLALDLDSQKAIDEARRLGVPRTWVYATGKGEQHFFRYPTLRDGLYIANAVQIASGMDVRSDGGYSIVPPSVHYSGKQYSWLVAPEQIPLAEAPEWFRDRLIIKSKTAAPDFNDEPTDEMIPQGERNERLFKIGASLRAKGLSTEEIRLVLMERNARQCDPPLSSDEVMLIASSIAQRYERGDFGSKARIAKQVEDKIGTINQLPDVLLTAPLTDSGNAECLIELFASDFRSSRSIAQKKSESHGIFYWGGACWQEDVEREFRDRAKWTARGRARIAEQAETKELRRAIYKHALQSENIGKLEAACELASTDSRLLVPTEAWDQDPFVLGLINGTLNLKTLEFRESDRTDYLTMIAPVRYDPDATAPRWEEAVSQIFADNPEIVPYWQRVLGYCLTGDMSEHKMWVLYGNGANGKTTLLSTIMALLGGFAGAATFSMFDLKGENDRNDALAGFRGKRFIAAAEGESQNRIAESKVKAVVSGDSIRCRFLHNNFFEYRPTFKVMLATNYLPEFRGSDYGIWRRVDVIPFNQTFTGDRRDQALEGKLRRELPGILNWCLAGLRSYWSGGLNSPEVVKIQIDTLKESLDTFTSWMDERLERTSGKDALRFQEAYLDYRAWMKRQGEWPLKRTQWQDRATRKQLIFDKVEKGEHFALGWKLSTNNDFGW